MKKTTRLTVQSPPPPPGGNTAQEPIVVGLYIRVSTDRQANEGDSLEEQESELRKYCDYRNFRIHKLYIERGKSGGNTNRPEYQSVIQDIEAQKINVIIVKKIDRLSRSLMDFEALMVLLDTHNVDFISLREQFDTTTAIGKAMLRITLIFAQLEREQTSERITDVMAYRARQGYYNGGPVPYGYHILNKELVPNKKEQAVVELIFSKFLETRSMSSVARFLNDTRLRNRKDQPWVDTQLQSMLENPVYIGQIRWKTIVYPGQHLPLISKTAFEETQAIFANSQATKKRTRSGALFQKLLHCGECQSVMISSFAYNRTKTRYDYYRCASTTRAEVQSSTCSLKYSAQSDLETQFFKSLTHLCHPTQLRPIQAKIDTYNHHLDEKISQFQIQIDAHDAHLTAIKSQRSKYLDTLISNDFLSKERDLIRTQIYTLETEERQTQSQLSHIRLEVTQFHETKMNFDQFKTHLIQLLELYQRQDLTQLQRQLPHILTSVIRYKTKWEVQFTSLSWPIEIPLFNNP